MTDLEISKALALAIGWNPEHIKQGPVFTSIYTPYQKYSPSWEIFDYRDWNVIGPIAERYDAFPYQTPVGCWVSCCHYAETPQKAIAMAVINGAKK